MQNVLEMNIDLKIQNYFNVIAQQNDDLIIIANVHDNGVPANLTGCTVIANYVNANNTLANIGGDKIKISGNKITIECPRDCTRSAGKANAQITIVSNSKQVSTFPIGIKINAGIVQGQTASKNVSTITEELNNASIQALNAKTGVVEATQVAKNNMKEVQETYVGATELSETVKRHSSQLEETTNKIDNQEIIINSLENTKATKTEVNNINVELNNKVNRNEVANGLIAKGSCNYSNLPVSGNAIGDYWYCGDAIIPGNYVWNGSNWYFGGTGNEGFSELKNDFLNITDIHQSKNLFDITKITENAVIDENGNPSIDISKYAGYDCSDFIKVEQGKTVYFSQTDGTLSSIYEIAKYGSNKSFISRKSEWINNYTVETGVEYIRVVVNDNGIKNNFMVSYNNNIPYEEYYEPYYSPKIPINVKMVDKNGSGTYSKISNAVKDATDGCTILVMPGNYTDEIIDAWGKDITIRGIDKRKTIITNSLDDYTKPPLQMGAGTLENVTVIAKKNPNGSTGFRNAYAMHIEDNNLFNKSLLVKNCNFIAYNGATVGMGMRGGCDVRFEDCYFNSPEYNNIGTSGYAFYFHDNADVNYCGYEKLTIKNCVFESVHTSGVVMRIDSEGNNGTTVDVTFIANICANYNHTNTYLSLHNISGKTNTDWNGLKNFRINLKSFGNNATQLNYVS